MAAPLRASCIKSLMKLNGPVFVHNVSLLSPASRCHAHKIQNDYFGIEEDQSVPKNEENCLKADDAEIQNLLRPLLKKRHKKMEIVMQTAFGQIRLDKRASQPRLEDVQPDQFFKVLSLASENQTGTSPKKHDKVNQDVRSKSHGRSDRQKQVASEKNIVNKSDRQQEETSGKNNRGEKGDRQKNKEAYDEVIEHRPRDILSKPARLPGVVISQKEVSSDQQLPAIYNDSLVHPDSYEWNLIDEQYFAHTKTVPTTEAHLKSNSTENEESALVNVTVDSTQTRVAADGQAAVEESHLGADSWPQVQPQKGNTVFCDTDQSLSSAAFNTFSTEQIKDRGDNFIDQIYFSTHMHESPVTSVSNGELFIEKQYLTKNVDGIRSNAADASTVWSAPCHESANKVEPVTGTDELHSRVDVGESFIESQYFSTFNSKPSSSSPFDGLVREYGIAGTEAGVLPVSASQDVATLSRVRTDLDSSKQDSFSSLHAQNNVAGSKTVVRKIKQEKQYTADAAKKKKQSMLGVGGKTQQSVQLLASETETSFGKQLKTKQEQLNDCRGKLDKPATLAANRSVSLLKREPTGQKSNQETADRSVSLARDKFTGQKQDQEIASSEEDKAFSQVSRNKLQTPCRLDHSPSDESAYTAAMKIRDQLRYNLKADKPMGELPPDKARVMFYKDQVPDLHLMPSSDAAKLLADSIIYENDDFIAVNKPYGLPSHGGPGIRLSVGQLLEPLARQIDTGKLQAGRLYLVHRLDKETTGVMLLAKNAEVAWQLLGMFRRREVSKVYWTVTKGVPRPKQGIIDIPLARQSIQGVYKTVVRPQQYLSDGKLKQSHDDHSKAAITRFSVLAERDSMALVECCPLTGVQHQIRVHLAQAMNTPVLGDHKYSHMDRLVPQKLFPEVLQKLGIRQAQVRYLPMHLHAKQLVLPEWRGKTNIFIKASIPHFFLHSLKRLKIDIPPK